MVSTRRGFIGGLVAVAAALVVPGEEQVRRFWGLDSSMLRLPVTWREVDPLSVVPEYGPEGLVAIAESVKNWDLYYADPLTMRPMSFTNGRHGVKATLDAPVRVVFDKGVWRIANTQPRDGVAGAERP